MRHLPLFFALCTLACDRSDETGTECPPERTLDSLVREGPAPWDGLWFLLEEQDTHRDQDACVTDPMDDGTTVRGEGTPLVLDATGTPVPLSLREGPYQDAPTWIPDSDLAAGSYTLAGQDGEDLGWDAPFTVEPFGRDPAFDPASVAGRTFQLDDESVSGRPAIRGWEYLFDGALYLRLGEPSDGQVDFTVALANGADPSYCSVFQGTAALSDTGELTWSQPSLTLSTSPALEATDLSLHLGFSADGIQAAGGVAGLGVDTEPITSLWSSTTETTACEVLEDLGADPCVPCPSTGLPTCAELAIYGARFYLTDDPVPADLEPCGLDWSAVDSDCGGCAASPGTGGPLWMVLALLTVGRRRRRG